MELVSMNIPSFNSTSNFNKLSRNLFGYLLNFVDYSELHYYLIVNKNFLESIRYFITIKMSKDKLLMDYYNKHIFLFNNSCNKNFQKTILPLIKNPKNVHILFADESLIIKKFFYNVEEETFEHCNLKSLENKDINNFYQRVRKNVLLYIMKLMNFHFEKLKIKELDLQKSNLGEEGTNIIAALIKNSTRIQYINLASSRFSEKDLNTILEALFTTDDYFFTLNLKGVSVSPKNLKFISTIHNNDYKKEIITKDNEALKFSKATSKNNKRQGKLPKKSKKNFVY